MVGSAMGARGAIPFPSTFAAFLTRAADFVRMAAISNSNVKFAGSHAGVSIGEDGPSQMALEDLGMFRSQPNYAVVYPCDAVSTEKLVVAMAEHNGPAYMRTSRPKTPVIYGPDETFELGGLKVVRQSANDVVTVVGAGVTLFEALKAHDTLKAEGIAIRVIDLYSLAPVARTRSSPQAPPRRAGSSPSRPLPGGRHQRRGPRPSAKRASRCTASRCARSAQQQARELLERFGISASHIVEAVKALEVKSIHHGGTQRSLVIRGQAPAENRVLRGEAVVRSFVLPPVPTTATPPSGGPFFSDVLPHPRRSFMSACCFFSFSCCSGVRIW
jgi:transketolase